jgi:hypothetical protein
MRGGPPNAILHQDDILGRAENEFISGCSCAIIRHLGEMDEWFKSPPWKGGTGLSLSRVRISLSPPVFIDYTNLRIDPVTTPIIAILSASAKFIALHLVLAGSSSFSPRYFTVNSPSTSASTI